MSLADEIRDVARRLALETGRTSDMSNAVRMARTVAMRLHLSYETACNREQTKEEIARETEDERRMRDMAAAWGVRVRFNGDPRGAPVLILCKREHSNSFDGEHIIIPYLPSAMYLRGVQP